MKTKIFVGYQYEKRAEAFVEGLVFPLLPHDVAQRIIGINRKPAFSCTYRLLPDTGEETPDKPAVIRPKGKAVYAEAIVPRNAQVQIHVQHGTLSWTSSFDYADPVRIVELKGGN